MVWEKAGGVLGTVARTFSTLVGNGTAVARAAAVSQRIDLDVLLAQSEAMEQLYGEADFMKGRDHDSDCSLYAVYVGANIRDFMNLGRGLANLFSCLGRQPNDVNLVAPSADVAAHLKVVRNICFSKHVTDDSLSNLAASTASLQDAAPELFKPGGLLETLPQVTRGLYQHARLDVDEVRGDFSRVNCSLKDDPKMRQAVEDFVRAAEVSRRPLEQTLQL